MRHNNGLRKLNRTSSHRKSLLRNLSVSLIRYEQIRTTLAKAKTLRPFVEKIITLAKKNDLHTIRKLFSIVRDQEIVDKLVKEIGPRSVQRAGGYTRIYKFGFRYGDSSPMGIIELVDKSDSDKKKKSATSITTENKEQKKPVEAKKDVAAKSSVDSTKKKKSAETSEKKKASSK